MTIDDFYSIISRRARVYVEQEKKRQEQDPIVHPLEMPYDLWFEMFDMFQETIAE